MASPLQKINHIVVVMMENRSFDNLVGWLYADANNCPPYNIPPPSEPGAKNTYAGLSPNTWCNDYAGNRVCASHPPKPRRPKNNANLVPDPDPHEEFDHMTQQIFGTSAPGAGQVPDMSGFLADYASANNKSPDQIMESFGPGDANVINQLARNFAVCDTWFASCPCQTWPNRGFVHTGSSDGHINNDYYELYDIPTIFNVLEERGISWGVFHDSTVVPSLTWGQFLPQLWLHDAHFAHISSFYRRCSGVNGVQLPKYSFIEPRFMPELGLFKIDYPEDYHPPHNVCRGEQFLADVYKAVRKSPYRDDILLVITFDEHGGIYDHVPPLPKATAPQPGAVSRYGDFHFDRFGVRVPAIVISSYVNPGTVFRAPPDSAPYDHTSILATLRDWLGLVPPTNMLAKLKDWFGGATKHPFLPSPRIAKAPTLEPVLTLPHARTDWPVITAKCQIDASDTDLDTPLNDVQKSLLAIATRAEVAKPAAIFPKAAIADLQRKVAAEAKAQQTYRDALRYLHPGINLPD
jgi:phospholipase C